MIAKGKKPRVLVCAFQPHAEGKGIRPANADPGVEAANEDEIIGIEVYNRVGPEKFNKVAWRKIGWLHDVLDTEFELVEIPYHDGTGPDQIFTADGTFTLVVDGKHRTVVSKFKNAKRQEEVERQIGLIKESDQQHGIDREFITLEKGRYFEGTGDAVYDPFRDIVIAGYADLTSAVNEGRSDKGAHAFLSEKLDVEFLSVKTRKPFYHLDTVLAPLPNGHVLINENAVAPDVLAEIKLNLFERFGMDPDEYLIPVSEEDARRFATNVRCVGDHVIIPDCSEDLLERIRLKGYKVTAVNLRELRYLGGSGHCLTNNIDEVRVVGGRYKDHGFVEQLPKVKRATGRALALSGVPFGNGAEPK